MVENIVNKDSNEKFQDATENTEKCHRETVSKTASARSQKIIRERARKKRLVAH